MSIELNMTSQFWNKESNNLFDYDSTEAYKREFSFNVDTLVIKRGSSDILTVEPRERHVFPENWIDILSFKINKDSAILIGIPNNIDKVFMTIKHTFKNENLFQNGFKIKEGDVLKFGKMIAIVKEMNLFNKSEQLNMSKAKEKTICENNNDNLEIRGHNIDSNNNLILRQNQNPNKENKKKHTNLCRFCLCEDNEDTNPLIAPCKCKGTMKYIHIDCLKNWLKSKVVTKTTPHMISYSFKQLECELCLTPVPMKFKIKSGTFDLIDMEKPSTAYVILEQQVKDDQERTYYLIIFRERTVLKMGRSNDSDVKLNDISVSRHHCNLFYRNGDIILEDNKSKFGSLVSVDSPINFILNKPIGLQIGNHLLIVEMNKTLCSSFCCFRIPTKYSNYNDLLKDVIRSKVKVNDMYITEQNNTYSQSDYESSKSEDLNKEIVDIPLNCTVNKIEENQEKNEEVDKKNDDTMFYNVDSISNENSILNNRIIDNVGEQKDSLSKKSEKVNSQNQSSELGKQSKKSKYSSKHMQKNSLLLPYSPNLIRKQPKKTETEIKVKKIESTANKNNRVIVYGRSNKNIEECKVEEAIVIDN